MQTITRDHAFAYSHPLARHVTNFSVQVVDGNGVEVASEPVTIQFLADGVALDRITTTTDGSGRVHVVRTHEIEPSDVIVHAGGESSGLIAPRPGAIVIIET